MSQYQKQPSATHQSAVTDILQTRRNALKWLMKLSVAPGVDWDSPIVRGNQTQFDQHPQRPAHGYVLMYAHNVANKAYWPRKKDLFTEPIETPGGDTFKATVPVQQDYEFVTDAYDAGDVVPSIDDLETKEEKITLETLNYKWQNRQVEVRIDLDSPYTSAESVTKRIDLWLPPKAISLAFKQLDELAASLDFLADADDELGTWGFTEVDQNGE